MNLIIFGAPGAGKGTQSAHLIEIYRIPAIATGDMLRAQRRAGTALGDQVKGYMDRGELVPDQLMIDIIKERLQKPDARDGFILDGFPRTVAQARALDEMLTQLGRRIAAVIYLRGSRQVLIDRVSPRYSCRTCEAGAILAEALARLQTIARPGITLLELDREADRFIRGRGCIPGFVGYQGYQNAICTSVNDQVVHGIPTNRKLREGDLLSLDAGLIHRGFWADAGLTVGIGKISDEAQRLKDVTRQALGIGIDKAQAGNRIGDISAAVQQCVETAGFSVVRQFVGHGIGRDMHEDPQVPNFGIAGRGPLLKPGMVLAIEPMVNAGAPDVALLGDGWTVVTVDHSLSAYFEHSVAITADGPEILTVPAKPSARIAARP